ncbi:MAG: hypothetical protein NTY42_24695 [Planctomycetota bacterium]|nr:hypothetical protein [Planctomycetota bacterium]
MIYCIYHRYGEQSLNESKDVSDDIFQALLTELREEQFAVNDNEHNSIGVIFDQLGISVNCSGVVTLFEIGSPDKELYMRDVPDRVLIPILVSLAKGDHSVVKAADWAEFEFLPPYQRDFYRK